MDSLQFVENMFHQFRLSVIRTDLHTLQLLQPMAAGCCSTAESAAVFVAALTELQALFGNPGIVRYLHMPVHMCALTSCRGCIGVQGGIVVMTEARAHMNALCVSARMCECVRVCVCA